jgi:hypothetical protein
MRLAAPAMQQVLGQPVILENRAGASGSVGAGRGRPGRAGRLHHAGRYRRRRGEPPADPGLPYDFARSSRR